MKNRPTAMACAVLGIILAAVGLFLKPARVVVGDRSTVVVLRRFQEGSIHFVNSVTHKPVTIRFRVRSVFSDFSMETDEETENYYTSGTYAIDPVLSRQTSSTLKLCSMQGIVLSVGDDRWEIQDGCLEVTLLWTF
uniref:Uncharacterized protein n=1 Tax=Desulfacinum infernum TaxID=35837 RepID=A0A832EJ23_9BACT